MKPAIFQHYYAESRVDEIHKLYNRGMYLIINIYIYIIMHTFTPLEIA